MHVYSAHIVQDQIHAAWLNMQAPVYVILQLEMAVADVQQI